MQKHLQRCFWLLCLLLSTTMFAQTNVIDPTRGVIRIKLQEEVARELSLRPVVMSNGVVATGILPFDRASKQVRAVKMERVFPYVEKMEAKARKHGLHLWYEIKFDENVNPKEAMQVFKQVPGVTISENIVPMELVAGEPNFVKITEEQMKQASANSRNSSLPFNDPLLSRQWHYNNDGTIGGSIVGADANIFEAWKIATGKKDVIVAIIDGGIDYEHPDLSANILINEAEINGSNGFDDDNNGYVDDIYGWNFVTNSGDIYGHTHGTHVAGTVGAVNNNGIGVAGVAGGNGQGGIKMLSCQVFDSRSNAQGDFAKAFYYAAVRGATIAQCSWGWGSAGYFEQAVLDAIKFFTAEAESQFMKGGLAIFANGNTGSEGDFYPACMNEVIAVGSMTCDKKPAPYSSYGDWVDITAPGGFMDFSAAQGVFSTLPNNEYGYSEGTSMACPHVSGIAALVLSKYGNPNFPNETLRQQLLNSVNDFYSSNPEVTGKYGSGYIDAYKALQMGAGNAPEPVYDFKMFPGQDNILVEWTIPASENDNVNYHLIYYSTSEFKPSDDLSNIPQKRMDTKFNSSGDIVNFEVNGLSPTTTYFIAIIAVDRWGNASDLSLVKSSTTNAGPKMELNKESLSLTLNANESSTTCTSFIIRNTDEGLLKWESFGRTISMHPTSTAEVNPGRTSPYNGKMSSMPFVSKAFVSSEYEADDYPISVAYYTSIAAYLGESDLKMSNSMAQWFYVDPAIYPDGFNLTDLYIDGVYGREPIIEIYNGNVPISPAGLLQNVKYDFFSYRFDIPLNEQLYFGPGDAFWLVMHYKPGNENPLTAGLSENEMYKTYSFYSSNMGNTWTQLSEVIREGNLNELADKVVWAVTAKSKNPDWATLLTLSPAKGNVKPNEQQDVLLSNDGQPMVNGTYNFNLKLRTNENGSSETNLPVSFNVSGNQPVLHTAKIVDFGDLLIGESKSLTVEIVNGGYGKFIGAYGLSSNNMTCSSDQFVMPTYHQGFAARSTSTLDITFKPTQEGSHSGTVVLSDDKGNRHTFIVRGIAAEPSKMTITPNTFEVGELEVGGATKQFVFEIKNDGKYPLEYVFPKFSDEQIENAGTTAHKFGYTYATNLNGSNDFEYDGNPKLVNPVDITKQFNDQEIWSEPISLGFSFPYYGESYDQIYVTNYGALAVAIEGSIHQCQIPIPDPRCLRGIGFITAYGMNPLEFDPSSSIKYAKQDGKFTVKFENVMAFKHEDEYNPISFRISISSNGDVEFFYDEIVVSNLFQQGGGLFVGLNDKPVKDPITLTSNDDNQNGLYESFTAGTAVKFFAPGKLMVKELSSNKGVIGIGESERITATLQASEGMYAGKLSNSLVVLSNDPVNSTQYVSFNANIFGESLKPTVSVESNEIDFGSVFRTSTCKLPVVIKNIGTDVLTVTHLTLENDKFNFSIETPFNIEAGTAKDVIITLPTTVEGSAQDILTIQTADGSELKVNLLGNVIGTPDIQCMPTSIKATVESGTPLSKFIIVNNRGNEDLIYSVEPNSFINLTDQAADSNSAVDYIYATSVTDSNVKYAWENIENNEESTQYKQAYWLNHDFVEVDLPYAITYYGNSYNKMYIYGVGFISFDYKDDLKEAPSPPLTLPTKETLYSNFMAPLWAYHFMNQTSTAGVYYTFKDDRIIVSFMEYGNSINNSVCYQAIIYKNGKIKYQYKLSDYENGALSSLFGVAGLQNQTGDKGVLLPERFVTIHQAIEFYPVKTTQIAPGQSSSIVLDFDTNVLAGNFNPNITINTNVPTKPTVEIPVELTITGKAIANIPTEITAETVTGMTNEMGVLEIPFNISNSGTAAFKIKNIEAEGLIGYEATVGLLQFYGTHIDDWFGEEFIGWGNYFSNNEIIVGKEPIQFKVSMFDNETIGEYTSQMVITLEGVDQQTYEVPFKLTITPAPNLMFAAPEVRISGVSNEYKDVVDVVMANGGDYKLTYSLSLDPTGIGAEDATDIGGGIAPMSKTKAEISPLSNKLAELTKAFSKKEIKSFEKQTRKSPDEPNIDYNRILFHPIYSTEPKLYLIGSGDEVSTFKAATQFTAPNDGFNLSSIHFYATVGALENAEIKVEIIEGNDITEGKTIGKGTLIADPETPNNIGLYTGKYRIIELDNPVYINANETFYVSFTFPAGHPHSAALVQKEEGVVGDRYMYQFEGGKWYDAAVDLEGQFGSVGYLTTCIETVSGEPWIKLLSQENGEIAQMESASIQVSLNAAAARHEKDNKAVLVVRSNDPNQKVVNYPIYLDKNAAPVIKPSAQTIYVKENGSSTATIAVSDKEGNSFTINMLDESGIASIQSYELANPSLGTIESVDENTIRVTSTEEGVELGANITAVLKPTYGEAGNYNFTITANDALNNQSKASITYYVEHVNRAPEAIAQADVDIRNQEASGVISYANMFNDPDGDEMTYTLRLSDNTIVDAFKTESGVIFIGRKAGQTMATVTATDNKGASTENTFAVNVTPGTSIADMVLNNAINIYPNPVIDNANITIDADIVGDITYKLYDTNAALKYSEVSPSTRGEVFIINMSALTTGVYYLEIEIDGNKTTIPVMKK